MEGRTVSIGTLASSRCAQRDPGPLRQRADDLRRDGHTVVFVVLDGQAAGLLAVADPVKPTSREAIETLRREGVSVVMLTGDNRTTADSVARSVGIDQVEADVLPERKGDVVNRFRRKASVCHGRRLHQRRPSCHRPFGIAMGTGADVAMESAQSDVQGRICAASCGGNDSVRAI